MLLNKLTLEGYCYSGVVKIGEQSSYYRNFILISYPSDTIDALELIIRHLIDPTMSIIEK